MHIQYESNLEHIRPSAARLVRRMITAWLGAAGIEGLLSPGPLAELSTIASMSPIRMVLAAAAIFAALHFIPEKYERWAMPVAFLPLLGSLVTSFTVPYLVACLLILAILIVYAIKGWAHVPVRPLTRSVESSGRIRFFGHEEKGAEMVPFILKRFDFQEEEIGIIAHAVRNHMRFANVTDMREAKLKRLIREEYFPLELELHRLDCISCHGKMACFDFLLGKAVQLSKEKASVTPFVSGKDLLALGMRPGRDMGELLEKVKEMQCAGVLLTREKALGFVKQTISKG